MVLAPGAKTVTLSAASGSTTPIAIGDLLLVIQMQDAAINATNTGAYGDNTPGDPATGYSNANSSGRYEFVTATSAVPMAGGTLTFSGAGPSAGLLNTYTAAAYSAGVQGQRTFQVIRVPQYQSATLSSTLAPIAWNGTVGGVLVIDVAGQLTLSGTVSADALGFRGGGGRQLNSGAGAQTDYMTLSSNGANGSKGEGIAGTPKYLVSSALTALITNTPKACPMAATLAARPATPAAAAPTRILSATTKIPAAAVVETAAAVATAVTHGTPRLSVTVLVARHFLDPSAILFWVAAAVQAPPTTGLLIQLTPILRASTAAARPAAESSSFTRVQSWEPEHSLPTGNPRSTSRTMAQAGVARAALSSCSHFLADLRARR